MDGTRVDDRDADEAREVVGVRRLVPSWTPVVRVLVPEPVARAAEPVRGLVRVGVLRPDEVTPRDVAPLRTAPADPWPLRVAVALRAADRVGVPARDADPARDDEPACDVEPARDDEPARDVEPARWVEAGDGDVEPTRNVIEVWLVARCRLGAPEVRARSVGTARLADRPADRPAAPPTPPEGVWGAPADCDRRRSNGFEDDAVFESVMAVRPQRAEGAEPGGSALTRRPQLTPEGPLSHRLARQ